MKSYNKISPLVILACLAFTVNAQVSFSVSRISEKANTQINIAKHDVFIEKVN